MYRTLGIILIGYGIAMDSLGTAGALYDPATGQLGFNPAAVSGVIAGGVCAAFSIVWGVMAMQGRVWAINAAKITTTLFAIAFGGRMAMAWAAFAGGASTKWYAATLITLMTLGSLAMLVLLFRARAARNGQ